MVYNLWNALAEQADTARTLCQQRQEGVYQVNIGGIYE